MLNHLTSRCAQPTATVVLSLIVALAAVLLLFPAAQAAASLGGGGVSVEKTGAGAGESTVISDPAGIDCGTECTHEFGESARVELTAEPGPGYVFAGWSGVKACEGGRFSNPCRIKAEEHEFGVFETVTASFIPPPAPPLATTTGFSEASFHSAKLEGQVDPEGFRVSDCHFEYGKTTAYGGIAPCLPAALGEGTAEVAVSAYAPLLDPASTYQFRLVASNAGGAADGEDLAFTTAAAPPEECPNAAIRAEQGVAATLLPQCRAYEMVSPLQKGGTNALAASGMPVAGDGDAAGFNSQSGFGDAENYKTGSGLSGTFNYYIARRGAAGWTTESALAPASVFGVLPFNGLAGVSPEDFSSQVACGFNKVTNFGEGSSIACAYRELGGAWTVTPFYPNLSGRTYDIGRVDLQMPAFNATFADGPRAFFTSMGGRSNGAAFLASDTSTGEPGAGDGIYELSGLDTGSPVLRLVNVEEDGNEIGPSHASTVGGLSETEYTGCSHGESANIGSSGYQAISNDGSIVYFTGCPTGGDVNVIFARVDNSEPDAHTVDISNPSPAECTTCSPTAASANFQGASRDGSKAFFLTAQQLLNADTDNTMDLYEYDFDEPAAHHIIQLSAGEATPSHPDSGAGANVQGVLSTSEGGSHVYFVATGVLTAEANPTTGLTAQPGEDNLYAVDTETRQTRFVATLLASDSLLWYTGIETGEHLAQTTPDGRYLVFDTYARLIASGPEADTSGAQQIYRYDFESGEIVRVSHGAGPGGAGDFGNNGNTPGMNATLPLWLDGASSGIEGSDQVGSLNNVNDWNRAISTDGSTIIFTTAEQLQADDVNGATSSDCDETITAGCDVYEWHDGTVSMISDGQSPKGVETSIGMSASGSDIFFFTTSQLVPQDTDQLQDLYDARIDGGFPAPPPETSCSGGSLPGQPASFRRRPWQPRPRRPSPALATSPPARSLPRSSCDRQGEDRQRERQEFDRYPFRLNSECWHARRFRLGRWEREAFRVEGRHVYARAHRDQGRQGVAA